MVAQWKISVYIFKFNRLKTTLTKRTNPESDLKIMKTKLTVQISGELGNQMFEVAAAHVLALEMNATLELYFHDNPNRLLEFNLSQDITFRKAEVVARNKLVQKSIKKLLKKYVILKFGLNTSLFQYLVKKRINDNPNVYIENIIHSYDTKFAKLKSPLEIRGYFQSWKYFDEYKALTKNLFELKNVSQETVNFLNELPSEFTALHIRRGNSGAGIIANEYHGFLPIDYYENAILLLKKLNSLHSIVIFTDNLEKTKKFIANSSFHKEVHLIISPQDINSQVENLWLMSNAKSLIGANSSYSWWAAYLSSIEDFNVVFPHPWYRERGVPDQEVIKPGWLSISFNEYLV